MVSMDIDARLDRSAMVALEGRSGAPVISIYHPTDRKTSQIQQNSNHLKTAIAQARDILYRHGFDRHDCDALLAPARSLVTDGAFWRRQLDGLAVFVWPGGCAAYRLPFETPQIVIVQQEPFVTHLLPALLIEKPFYVLALSRNGSRLLRATILDVEEVDLSALGAPTSVDDALRFSEFHRELQSHATAKGGRQMWHGHGFGDEDVKDNVAAYFHEIDGIVRGVVSRDPAPVVLAGVAAEQSMYREMTHCDRVLEDGIEGSPDLVDVSVLVERGHQLAVTEFQAPMRAARDEVADGLVHGTAGTGLEEIVPAAAFGRTKTLLVSNELGPWGIWRPSMDGIEIHDPPRPEDVELADLAVRHTLRLGGDAYLLDASEMPFEARIAAVYRYGEGGIR